MAWYVSHSGIDTQACGRSPEIQCLSIGFVIGRLNHGDVVNIDGTDSEENFYWFCAHDAIDITNKSVTFEGVDGMPRIGCTPWNTNDTIAIFTNTEPNSMNLHTIALKNLVFENGILKFQSSSVEIVNVTFHNASLQTDAAACTAISLYISRCKWFGKSTCKANAECFSTATNNITCEATDLSIHRTEFHQTMVVVDSRRETLILVSEILVSNTNDEAQHLGGLHLTFSVGQADIMIRNSRFTHQLHPSRVKSVTNLFEAAIWLKVGKGPKQCFVLSCFILQLTC